MRIFTTLFIFAFLPVIGFSQHTLRGTVTDSTNGDQLVGINVVVEGTSLGGSTDIEGYFSVQNIPSGNYTIRISCVGYEQQRIPMNFSEQTVQTLNVRLSPTVLVGDEVVITAQMRGQLAAINQQITANTIVNVISEDRIKELPDANAADAIGRLSGVSLIRSGGEASKVILRGLSSKFSVVTIDGNRMSPTDANERGVDLSTISQGSLAGIELFKAATSDKDGDAIAGSVNLVTKKAPSTRLLRLEPRGNYNGLDKSADQYNFSGRYGERFFDDLFGLQISGNAERMIRSNESTDINYDTRTNSGKDYIITLFSPLYTNEIRKRNGGSIILDFDTPDEGHILLNSVVNHTSRNYLTSYRTYPQSGQVIYDYRDKETEITTFNSFLHGENNVVGMKIHWNVAFTQAKSSDPFDYELNFTESSDTTAGMKNVPPEYLKGPVDRWAQYAWNNFQAAYIDHANDNTRSNFDKEQSASLDLSKQYSLLDDISGEIKFGGKFRQKSRYAAFRQARAISYLDSWPLWKKQPDGTIVKKDLSGTRFENLTLGPGGIVIFTNFLDPIPERRDIYEEHPLNPMINRDALRLWRQLNINGYNDQTGNDAEYKINA
ncbi:MAG: carboxypeptidase-like regulatory domain-containing protein, partial [Bacteriovoracaceae bacterium]